MEERNIDEVQITEAGRKILGILGLIMTSYPYSGKGMLHRSNEAPSDFDDAWIEELTQRNNYLTWLWNTYALGLHELMSQYSTLKIKHQQDRIIQQYINQRKDTGIPVTQIEIDNIRRYYHIPRIDYNSTLQEFFTKIKQIQEDIIPKIKENKVVIKTNENQYKIKSMSLWILAVTGLIFIFGIIVPIIINSYISPPRTVELTILMLTMLPYLCGLYLLMRKICGLEMP